MAWAACEVGWQKESVGDARLHREHDGSLTVDATGVYYRQLNEVLRKLWINGERKFNLRGITGQRYIGTSLGHHQGSEAAQVQIYGTPGSDLGAFMQGPEITVFGNAQDGTGNTMDSGRIVIHGNAGDTMGMSMRGGEIFLRGNVGYRTAIHMKEYGDKCPLLVIGGTAQDFFGEYMAGGRAILLGLNLAAGEAHRANFVGTGMHGGAIYIRGRIETHQLGKEVGVVSDLSEADRDFLTEAIGRFATYFDLNAAEILRANFVKLYPKYLRPYGTKYAY